MLEVGPLAPLDQRQRHFTVKMEMPQVTHQPDIFPVADTGKKGVHEHQAFGLLRELRRVGICHHQPDVVANDGRAVESERLDYLVDVHGHVLLIVAGFWFTGTTRAAKVGDNDGVIRSEQRHDVIPHVTGLSIAVQQNHRAAFAANGVVDSRSIHLDISLRETAGVFSSSSKYGAGQQQSEAGEKLVPGHSHFVFQPRSPR